MKAGIKHSPRFELVLLQCPSITELSEAFLKKSTVSLTVSGKIGRKPITSGKVDGKVISIGRSEDKEKCCIEVSCLSFISLLEWRPGDEIFADIKLFPFQQNSGILIVRALGKTLNHNVIECQFLTKKKLIHVLESLAPRYKTICMEYMKLFHEPGHRMSFMGDSHHFYIEKLYDGRWTFQIMHWKFPD